MSHFHKSDTTPKKILLSFIYLKKEAAAVIALSQNYIVFQLNTYRTVLRKKVDFR